MKSPFSGADVDVDWVGPGPETGKPEAVNARSYWHYVREPDGTSFVASELYCRLRHAEPLSEERAAELLGKAKAANEERRTLVFMVRDDVSCYEAFGLDPKVHNHRPFHLA